MARRSPLSLRRWLWGQWWPWVLAGWLSGWIGRAAETPGLSAGSSAASAVPAPGTNGTWWAFQPLRRPELPRRSEAASSTRPHPIDAFVEARLRERGLTPNPPATRRELIRRVTLDLTGLPPTLAEVREFERDERVDAWERLIDRLLARPEYGERWARHWLDVVRFAQSNGYERDSEKPYAWRYRDYVVNAFNRDLPWDRFVREHLAGDELAPFSPDAAVATGYARLGVFDDEPDDKEMAVFDELDDVLSTTGVAFLGMTLGCARCHEHKFDPLSQADYYRLLAFFRGVEPMRHITDPVQSTAHVGLAGPNALPRWQAEHARRVAELEEAVKRAANEAEKKSVQTRLDSARREEPPFELALGMREISGPPPVTQVLRRGNARTPGDTVHPEIPVALELRRPNVGTPAYGSAEATAVPGAPGRRTALADWVASPENPLTARVIVNRIWYHHFGRGLVKTLGDFGRAGARPTHPELLDWLATEFIAHGWSVKFLHRLILTSETYRRSSALPNFESAVRPGAEVRWANVEKDPANEGLWRQNLRRLEAEAVRDSVLAVSGQLNRRAGGRGFFPHLSGEVLAGGSRPGTDWEISTPAEESRRSLYAYVRRTQAIPFLESLDYANTTSPLIERPITTVAPQALLLLNEEFMGEQAAALAGRLARSVTGGSAGSVEKAQWVRTGFETVLAREPSAAELDTGIRFLERQQQRFEQLGGRLTFRADVPATMNESYFRQLRPSDFLQAPPGWEVGRGHWPDSYEGNRIMARDQGPFALWPGVVLPQARLDGQLTLTRSFESGGILFRARRQEGAVQGDEVSLDAREGVVRLRRWGSQPVVLASAAVSVQPGQSLRVRLEYDATRVQVWLGESARPVLDWSDSSAPPAGTFGFRAWGGALHVEHWTVESAGVRLTKRELGAVSDPPRQAREAFALLLLNLNEFVYVD